MLSYRLQAGFRRFPVKSYIYFGQARTLSDSPGPDHQTKAIDLAKEYFTHREAKFLISAFKKEHYTKLKLPEVTFAGRSNVGKSSLLNSVLHSRRLVKISRKPGHTSALNFFNLSSKAVPGEITLVDMPGYGYRSRNEWGKFTMDYLSGRKELRRVFLLIEAKVGELKTTDAQFLELAESYNVPTQIVVTKTDKLRKADLDKISLNIVQEAIDIAPSAVQPKVIHCSSRLRTGIDNLQREILQVCSII